MYIVELFKSLFQRNKSQKAPPQVQVVRDGVNVIICDSNEQGATLANKMLQKYTNEEHDRSLLFTDFNSHFQGLQSIDGPFDPERLDTWVLKRSTEPEEVAYLVVNSLDQDVLTSPAFLNVIDRQELLNIAIYVVMPVKRLVSNFVKTHATRVFLHVTPRRVPPSDRLNLYSMLKTKIPNSTWTASWLSAHKEKKVLMFDNSQETVTSVTVG